MQRSDSSGGRTSGARGARGGAEIWEKPGARAGTPPEAPPDAVNSGPPSPEAGRSGARKRHLAFAGEVRLPHGAFTHTGRGAPASLSLRLLPAPGTGGPGAGDRAEGQARPATRANARPPPLQCRGAWPGTARRRRRTRRGGRSGRTTRARTSRRSARTMCRYRCQVRRRRAGRPPVRDADPPVAPVQSPARRATQRGREAPRAPSAAARTATRRRASAAGTTSRTTTRSCASASTSAGPRGPASATWGEISGPAARRRTSASRAWGVSHAATNGAAPCTRTIGWGLRCGRGRPSWWPSWWRCGAACTSAGAAAPPGPGPAAPLLVPAKPRRCWTPPPAGRRRGRKPRSPRSPGRTSTARLHFYRRRPHEAQ